MYRVYAYIDLDTDFFASWSDYTSVAKQVRKKDGVIILKSEPKQVQTNGYPIPIYFDFKNEAEAKQYNFYFDVYYKKKLVAVDIRSRAWGHVPANIETPAYRLKDGHRDKDFKADHSKFKESVKKAVEKENTTAQGKIKVIQKTESITSHSDGDVPVTKQVITNDINKIIQQIGDVISHGEGGYEGWNAGTKTSNGKVHHGSMNGKPGTVTGKTINQILSTESISGENPNRLFATGKYQTIISTLREAKAKLKLTGEELYTPELQERVFRDFLFEKAGGGKLADYVKRGEGAVDDAMYAASKEWASIAAPKGKTTKNKNTSDGTKTYYDDGANHANQQSTTRLRELLESIKLGASTTNTIVTQMPATATSSNTQGVVVGFNGVNADRQSIVSQKTKNILAEIAKECGMTRVLITSTLRTPEEQARAMWGGTRYAAAGENVKAIGAQYNHLGAAVRTQKMAERIRYYWTQGVNVSKHCVSPEAYAKKNVVDIGLNSNALGSRGANGNTLTSLGQKFKEECLKAVADGRIAKLIPGDARGEGAFHIEIDQ